MAQIVFKFEKFIAQKKDAFSVGTDYGGYWFHNGDIYNHVDTSEIPVTAEKYYKRMKYNTLIYTEPRYDDMLSTHYMKSNILYFAGHGNNECILWNYLETGFIYKTGVIYGKDYYSEKYGYNYVGLVGNMDYVDLAVFLGCGTAKGTDNLPKRACQNGAKVAIGWTDVVCYDVSRNTWSERFNKALSEGETIKKAIEYADSTLYLPGSNIKDWKVYYTDEEMYKSTSLKALGSEDESKLDVLSEEHPKNILSAYGGSTEIQGENPISEVASIISSIDTSFDINCHAVHLYNHNDGSTVIDFVRVLGGFETDSGYTARLEGNTLCSICDNTKSISPEAEAYALKISNQSGIAAKSESCDAATTEQAEPLAEALQLALEAAQSSPAKEVIQQRYCYYFDVENNQPCILVYTDYYYDGTEAIGVDVYTYLLG